VLIVSAPGLLIDGELRGPGAVVIDGGTIVETVNGRPAPAPHHVALDSGILSPGLVDVQINGCLGVDFSAASEQDWVMISRALPALGVTAFQPTYITAPIPMLVAALRSFAAVRPVLDEAGGARAVGVHLEGPFLSAARRGVHDVAFMVEPTPANLEALLSDPLATAQISMITVAPELPHALEAVRRLCAAGIVVSVGHSDAVGSQVHDAVIAGASMVTHIFNAQRGFGHREPGVAGQALAEPSMTIGLVADFEHVAPAVCEVVLNAAAGRVALVSDAVATAGMPPGAFQLGHQRITARTDAALPRNEAGTIAGSVTFLDKAMRNLVSVGRDIAEVLNAATAVPADVLHRADIGRLVAGTRADIVWWSDTLHPLRTWIGGREIGPTRSG
jgi:N-acetylglucosamine-6-phosphate deacetylase